MNPLSFPESHKDKSVTPEHALAELLDELTDPLEKFLRELKTVKCNYVYTLPSKNTFEITEEGIVFGRNGREELRKVTAKDKGARLGIQNITYDPKGRILDVTAKKRLVTSSPDPQLLQWREIVAIFDSVEQKKTYTRPNEKDGHIFQTIIEVSMI